MQRKLNHIHEQLKAENQLAKPELKLVKPEPQNAGKLRKLWNRNAPSMAVAASISALAVLGTLWGTGAFQTKNIPHQAQYRELRRDMDKIKRTQTDMINGINRAEAKAPATVSRFSGTGFAISADGYVLTSYHVVRDADSIFIESTQGQRYKADQVYVDTAHDIAILRVNSPEFKSFGKLPYSFKNRQSDLGERVFTLGYPREDVVFGEGSLSALTGYEGDSNAYQISIPVNPGNSGGPLLDERGNLIGVISGTQTETQGAAFAIKSSYVLNRIDSLSRDTLQAPIKVSKYNALAGSPRPQQLKKLRDFVFLVKVYN